MKSKIRQVIPYSEKSRKRGPTKMKTSRDKPKNLKVGNQYFLKFSVPCIRRFIPGDFPELTRLALLAVAGASLYEPQFLQRDFFNHRAFLAGASLRRVKVAILNYTDLKKDLF